MKKSILYAFAVLILFSFCKSKKPEAVSSRPPVVDDQKVLGTVSHKHGMCGTVVELKSAGPGAILVPYPALDKEYDVDGLSIKFTYRKLRMPQRENCESGIMAELKDVEKSK
jgi:hypothetical protein